MNQWTTWFGRRSWALASASWSSKDNEKRETRVQRWIWWFHDDLPIGIATKWHPNPKYFFFFSVILHLPELVICQAAIEHDSLTVGLLIQWWFPEANCERLPESPWQSYIWLWKGYTQALPYFSWMWHTWLCNLFGCFHFGVAHGKHLASKCIRVWQTQDWVISPTEITKLAKLRNEDSVTVLNPPEPVGIQWEPLHFRWSVRFFMWWEIRRSSAGCWWAFKGGSEQIGQFGGHFPI